MASILELTASSDSEDDFDYVPSTVPADSDSSFDEEDVSEDEGFNSFEVKKEKTKKGKQHETEVTANNGNEKERMENLWESFLSDVDSITPKKSNSGVCNNNTTTDTNNKNEAKDSKIDSKSVSEIFEFAGEPVTVSDLKPIDSTVKIKDVNPIPVGITPGTPKKRGIDSVLGTIMNKNKKLNVLEKSAIDWKTFKKNEGLDNDLEKFNKGKQGFIERQRFLERSDLRSFEVEKSLRQTLRKK